VSTASFNGTGLTLLDTQRISVSGASAVTETWFLKAPANTSAPVLLTFSASVDEAVAICHSLTGVNQSTTFGTVAKASSVAGSSRAECDVAEPCLLVTSQSGALVEEIMWFDSPNPRACYVHGVGPTGIARPAAVSTFCLGFPAAWYDTNGTSTRTQVYQYEEAGASSVSVDWFMAGNDLSGRHWNLMAFGINP
jgi:hypothetical protein